jgi:hypothetical protein
MNKVIEDAYMEKALLFALLTEKPPIRSDRKIRIII